ncbi:hypothetical protein Cgig2_014586 [Carnegiea gigantea]|uniref:PX domain-containing protein n=1 Tax=Carnegiea gigantea TaxID=171969 RepID=A0A9Q1L1L2_9CARY|nr:hypothetical protein Cgig2_014586 [Carnegiea gigantea]
MNAYGMDLSLLDFGLSDQIVESLYPGISIPASPSKSVASTSPNRSPPRHRHDGTSPLPLGMDWSPPPRKWDGRDTVWPHDPRTGWSYCATIPSWSMEPNLRGSGPVVGQFYRVQIGVQTPEAVTTTREILCRFSDFLKLFSELKKSFPKKKLPLPPPRKLLGAKSQRSIEERRRLLEDWMEKLLSDIDISRSVPVAIFLELEAAARSSFNDPSGYSTFSFPEYQPRSDVSVVHASSVPSYYADDNVREDSDIGTPRRGGSAVSELSREDSASDIDLSSVAEMNGAFAIPNGTRRLSKESPEIMHIFSHDKLHKGDNDAAKKNNAFGGRAAHCYEDGQNILSEEEDYKAASHATRLSVDTASSEVNLSKGSKLSNWGASRAYDEDGLDFFEGNENRTDDNLKFSNNLVMALPSEQRQKFSRVLVTLQRRLATAKADMEDLVARLNQELAVRQYLTTKEPQMSVVGAKEPGVCEVKDLEVELDTTQENAKDNLQQALSIERERYTQMQWDTEEFRKRCLEMELKLKAEQDEMAQLASEHENVIQENEMLKQELDAAREELQNLQKHQEESEVKLKTDIKVLVKEVKYLRNSQTELKQELSKVMKEKLDVEKVLQHEKQMKEHASSFNEKLLHECAILQKRLQDCSVNFSIEEGDKLLLDSPSPADAIDLLNTSNNRIGLLLAEAQLLAQDIENSIALANKTSEDELRKMLTEIFIDSATVRRQLNSVIRCALTASNNSEKDCEEEEATPRKTVLSKFL